MKFSMTLVLAVAVPIFAVSCESRDKKADKEAGPVVKTTGGSDVPLLPVKKGDTWEYEVRLEIPAGITSPGAAEVDSTHTCIRTYLGKILPAEGLPETDCLEVTSPGSPALREFVEIHEDKILMRGSMVMRPDTTRPMWQDHAVPFVVAGMKPGTESPEVRAPGGSLIRKMRVLAREDVTVPAGTFPAIRLLMSGMDGELELRRTIWFSPGTGIVREEKSRYRAGQVVFRETQQLTKTSVARRE